MLLILLSVIFEMLMLREYNKDLSLFNVYLSHVWSAILLGFLLLRFVQWFGLVRFRCQFMSHFHRNLQATCVVV